MLHSIERSMNMNKVIQIGRLTGDPDVSYSQGAESVCIARYSLAVDRKFKRENEPTADFIRCVAFGKNGEFAEKYFRKGMKVAITGRIQTGSYKDRDNKTIYTTDVIVEEQEFCESKKETQDNAPAAPVGNDGFMNIPDGIDEELPFN